MVSCGVGVGELFCCLLRLWRRRRLLFRFRCCLLLRLLLVRSLLWRRLPRCLLWRRLLRRLWSVRLKEGLERLRRMVAGLSLYLREAVDLPIPSTLSHLPPGTLPYLVHLCYQLLHGPGK